MGSTPVAIAICLSNTCGIGSAVVGCGWQSSPAGVPALYPEIDMARPTGRAKKAAPPAPKPAGRSPQMPRIAPIAQRLGRMIPEEELRRIPKDARIAD